MTLVASDLITLGDSASSGTIHFNLGDVTGKFHFKVTCPNQRKHERHHHIKKNGHDGSVKGHPQQYYCHTCGGSFYAHTSGYFHGLFNQLKQRLKRALKGGRLDLQLLIAKLDLSPTAASRLLAALLRHLHDLAELHRYKELPRNGKVLFCDETFLTIQGEQWYIVVLRNEEGKVLDAFLVRHRSMDVLLPHFRKALQRMPRGVEVIVTDDFTAYQAVVLALQINLVHVRCIHKPPYGRVVIDAIQWEGRVAHYTTAATISDVLKEGNTFLARVSKHDKKPKKSGGKLGRPKNHKNRPKEVILAEKAERARKKAEKARQAAEAAELEAEKARQEAEKAGLETENAGQEIKAAESDTALVKPPLRRGRKNYTREGEVHVFHYNPTAKEVQPVGGSDEEVARVFTILLKYFVGLCITTNLEEGFFSVLKRLIHFSGWRAPELWANLIDLHVVLRQEKGAVAHLVNLLEFRPSLLRKNLNKLIKVRISSSA